VLVHWQLEKQLRLRLWRLVIDINATDSSEAASFRLTQIDHLVLANVSRLLFAHAVTAWLSTSVTLLGKSPRSLKRSNCRVKWSIKQPIVAVLNTQQAVLVLEWACEACLDRAVLSAGNVDFPVSFGI